MTCDEMRALLAEGAGLPEEGEAHLAACPDCRAAAQRWAAVRQGLAALREEPPPPFLHPRIMAAVRRAAAPPVPWWRRQPRTAWASAGLAAVLVAGVLATQGVLHLGRVERAVMDETAPQAAPPGAADVVAEHVEMPEVEAAAKGLARPPQESARTGVAAPRPAAPAPTPPGPRREREKVRQGVEMSRQLRAGLTPPPAPPAATAAPAPGAGEADEMRMAAADASPAGPVAVNEAVRQAAVREGRVAAAPRWRGQEVAATAASPARIAVALLAASGEEAFALLLDEAAAPPPAQVWVVVIGEDGHTALEGPPEAALAELLPAWQRALAGADLPAGRYRAVRLRR